VRAGTPRDLAFLGWAPDGASVLAQTTFRAQNVGVPERSELWWIPLDSRQPRKLHEHRVSGDSGWGYALSSDGRRIAFSVAPDTERKWDVWAMDNLLQNLSPKK
jgi:hypothetical protein